MAQPEFCEGTGLGTEAAQLLLLTWVAVKGRSTEFEWHKVQNTKWHPAIAAEFTCYHFTSLSMMHGLLTLTQHTIGENPNFELTLVCCSCLY